MGTFKDYFSFSKRERTGAIFLVIVILIVFLLPDFFPEPLEITDTASFEELRKQLDSLKEKEPDSAKNIYHTQKNEEFAEHFSNSVSSNSLFHFDPNTLSADGWKKLGLSERTIQTIRKYISKGGSFRQAEDLAKIYGLSKSLYEQLLPYVRIQQKNEYHRTGKVNPDYKKTDHFKDRLPQVIDVNQADTTMMISLPGIGSKLANRILRFREKLGGFYSVEQLSEVYGLQDSVFQKIKHLLSCGDGSLQKININTAELLLLRNHPYIKPEVANAIINYRQQHGSYGSIDELKKIEIISPEMFQKILPYLTIQ